MLDDWFQDLFASSDLAKQISTCTVEELYIMKAIYMDWLKRIDSEINDRQTGRKGR